MGGGGYDEIEELYDGIQMDDRERLRLITYLSGALLALFASLLALAVWVLAACSDCTTNGVAYVG
jgi:hypothetical protein